MIIDKTCNFRDMIFSFVLLRDNFQFASYSVSLINDDIEVSGGHYEST